MQVITERFSVISRLVNTDDCQHYLDDGHGQDGQNSGTPVLNMCHIYPVVVLINHIVVIRLTSHIDFTDYYTSFFCIMFSVCCSCRFL